MLRKEQKCKKKRTLENVKKYREYNISVSYIKSLSIGFDNFILRIYKCSTLLEPFHQIGSLYKKMMLPVQAPHRFSIFIQRWQYLFFESPNCHSIDNVGIWTLPRPLKNQHHLQKPIMNKVVVWKSLETRFEQIGNFEE